MHAHLHCTDVPTCILHRGLHLTTVLTPHSLADASSTHPPAKKARELLPARIVAERLRLEWEQEKSTWGFAKLQHQVQKYHPEASDAYVIYVRRLLNQGELFHCLDDKQQNELLQGLAECLRRRGWAVSLLSASGSTVLAQAVDMAAAKCNNQQRKRHPRGSRIPFDVRASLTANGGRYPDVDVSGNPIRYLMGYVIVPANVRGTKLRNFIPVSCLDWCRATGDAQGSYVGRSLKDANGHILPITIGRLLCTEAATGCTKFHEEEAVLHGGEAVLKTTLNSPSHVHFSDGGVALRACNKKANPEAGGFLFDYRHYEEGLVKNTVGRRAAPVYRQLVRKPPQRVAEANRILDQLKVDDKQAHKVLEDAGFGNLFAAFLGPEASTHGTITSNDIEQLFGIMKSAGVRATKDMLSSMFATAAFVIKNDERRWKSYEAVAKRYGGEGQAQPPRLLEALCTSKSLMTELSCTANEAHPGIYSVTSARAIPLPSPQSNAAPNGEMYDVVPSAATTHAWGRMCDCGGPRMKWSSVCHHVMKASVDHPSVLGSPPYVPFQKPWTTMSGWQKQLPEKGLQLPTWAEVMDATQYLKSRGELLNYRTVDIRLDSVKRSKSGDDRAHSALEEAQSQSGSVLGDQILGAVIGNARKKPGPKPGAVVCSVCHTVGHRADRCTQSAEMLGLSPSADTERNREASFARNRHLDPAHFSGPAVEPELTDARSDFETAVTASSTSAVFDTTAAHSPLAPSVRPTPTSHSSQNSQQPMLTEAHNRFASGAAGSPAVSILSKDLQSSDDDELQDVEQLISRRLDRQQQQQQQLSNTTADPVQQDYDDMMQVAMQDQDVFLPCVVAIEEIEREHYTHSLGALSDEEITQRMMKRSGIQAAFAEKYGSNGDKYSLDHVWSIVGKKVRKTFGRSHIP